MQNYKILKVIGKGAFGDAYLGINVLQKKQYVIKQVDIKNKSKQQKQHIFHQVKLLQQFHHVNIVSYRDSFIDKKGLLNIVMEYCEGGDMNQIIQSLQGDKIEQDKIVYWMAQIALAIFYMHQKKILHRDLKSPNIFILKGNIRLGDFGISKVLDHVRDLAQTNIGTPYYMSPQQYNHKPYSYKSDIWAFGCILYEMCNQRRPFEANNIQALGMKVVRGNFPPVSECYSKDLRKLISDMLEKNPTKRPNIIQILLKPFIKKKVIQYMRKIYSIKDTISKETLDSFLQQADKLSVILQEKPIITKPIQSQKQRSTSARKKRLDEDKQKQKLQRQKKKLQLQKQLSKHNKERKQMAQNLKKIQEERKKMLNRKKSQKNIKNIYQKTKQTNPTQASQRKQYISQKYSNSSSKVQSRRGSTAFSELQKQKSISQVSKHKESVHQSVHKLPHVQSLPQIQVQSTAQIKKQQITPVTKMIKKVLENSWIGKDKKFKMEEQYQMDFEECQPDQQHYFQDFQEQQKTIPQNSKDRLPTFANDQGRLARQVEEIKNLVMVSNQAVRSISKNQNYSKQKVPIKQVQTNQVKKIQVKQVVGKQTNHQVNQPIMIRQSQLIQIMPAQINEKVQSLKHELKMKTQHINSIYNQLSNIDFSLSQSDENMAKDESPVKNFSKKALVFNPQHAKIKDRINSLQQSATTILGGQKYSTFYQFLLNIKQKGRTIKRDYLEQVLGRDKIGAYHLVEQIVRLTRVVDKVPKYLQ